MAVFEMNGGSGGGGTSEPKTVAWSLEDPNGGVKSTTIDLTKDYIIVVTHPSYADCWNLSTINKGVVTPIDVGTNTVSTYLITVSGSTLSVVAVTSTHRKNITLIEMG